MDPAADVSAGILRKRFERRRAAARQLRQEGDRAAAAEEYRNAAKTLDALADLRGVDRDADIDELRQAAELLEGGQSLETDPGADATSHPGDRSAGRSDADDGDDDFRGVAESFIASTDAMWDDIGGLDSVVETVKRSIVLGAVDGKPDAAGDTKGILLHGPPGTGKTLLAAAVAGSLDTTFFEVNTGDLLSKYFGESSKQISALFDVARELAPSVVFLDEVDSLTTARDDDTNGAARRVLDTLLSELDGLDEGDDFVLPVASTNTPWDLDRAVRRRFEQRILVPLPDIDAAREIVRIHTVDGGVTFADADPRSFVPSDGRDKLSTDQRYESPADSIANEVVTQGFSGHDIAVLCKEAVNSVLFRANDDLASYADAGDIAALQSYDLTVPPIPPQAMRQAFETVSPSLVEDELQRYETWHEEYGTNV